MVGTLLIVLLSVGLMSFSPVIGVKAFEKGDKKRVAISAALFVVGTILLFWVGGGALLRIA